MQKENDKYPIREIRDRLAGYSPKDLSGDLRGYGSYDGAITVFLALIFVCTAALILTLAESARIAGLHYHMKVASNSALESLFSEYHNELWDRYRITAYEYLSEESAMRKITQYMKPYMDADSWMRMDSAEARPTGITALTGGEGEYFEQEVLSFMNYGLAESLFDPEASGDADTLRNRLKESRAIDEITADYAGKTKTAVRGEESLDRIADSLSIQQSLKAKALSALRSGSGDSFDLTAGRLISEMNRMAGDDGGLIREYEEISYDLEAQLGRVDEDHAGDYGDLSESGRDIIRSIKNDYSGYSDTEKGRREEVEEIYSVTQDNIAAVYSAREAADRIEEMEEELAEERAAAAAENSDDPDFDPDPADYMVKLMDLWRELADTFDAVDIRTLQCEHGLADKEKQGFLETAAELLSGEILLLTVPEVTQISDTHLNMKGDTAGSGRTLPYLSALDRAKMAEYIGHYFTEFTDERTGVAAYEMEYICAGRGSDRDDLSAAVAEVFAIREGLNYLHIMMDETKRNEARGLAAAIVGTSGGTLTVLIPVIECLIIGVWAGAESVLDCRALLKGNKVALYKNNEQWKTDAASVLRWGQNRDLTGSDEGDRGGLTYEGYLKFLILLLDARERNSRTMDIIELNLCQNDPDFMMSRCIYGMDIEVTADFTHIFASLPVISGEVTGFPGRFSMRTAAKKEY